MREVFEKTLVTADNIDEIREAIPVLDQRAEIEVGRVISTWPIYYQPGNQRGQITVFHDTDRAAVCYGGYSEWGDWNDEEGIIILDDPNSYPYVDRRGVKFE